MRPSAPARHAFTGLSPAASRSVTIRSAYGCRPSPNRCHSCASATASPGARPRTARPPAHPSPGRDTGLLLGGPQRCAGRTAAVADDDLAQVIPVRLPTGDLRDIHHGDQATRAWPARKGRSVLPPSGRERRPNFLSERPSDGKRFRPAYECHRSPVPGHHTTPRHRFLALTQRLFLRVKVAGWHGCSSRAAGPSVLSLSLIHI